MTENIATERKIDFLYERFAEFLEEFGIEQKLPLLVRRLID